MDNNIKKIRAFFKKKEVLNFSYLSAFFLIFAIFIVFAIRPAVLSIFMLNKEIEDLKIVDDNYNRQIDKIITIQSEIEKNREEIFLINQAIPNIPYLSDLIKEIRNTTDTVFPELKEISVSKVNILEVNRNNNSDSENIFLTVKVNGNFDQINNFLKKTYNQRRLKLIKNILIQKNLQESTESGELNITLEINGFFL